MAQDSFIDMRPHPLGIGFHPNWQAVRDRRAERECNLIQRQAAEERAAARRERDAASAAGLPGRAFVIGLEACAVLGVVGCFWWALA